MFSLLAAGQSSRKFTVSGYVTDIESGESLIGAGVFSVGKAKTGVSTNEFGWYNVSLRKGRTTIEYHYVGYEPRTIDLDLNKDTVINVTLSPSASLSEAVVVARNNAGIRSTNMSALDVPISQVIKSPTLFGESDIIKFLQMLPGVQGGMEGTTGIHVRGGSQDENLVMLDGIPIYNIDHVLGIFSVFTPEAVKKVTFYKGAFPARYGGRISSIVDVRTNDGNLKETHGVVSVGMLTSRVHVEGPLKQDKTSFSLSFRGMHTLLYQPFIKFAMKDEAKANFYFYDANAKVSHKFDDRNRLYLGVYNGWDKLTVDDLYDEGGESEGTFSKSADKYRIGWGNTIAAMRLNHIFSSTLFSNTTVALNNYRMSIQNKYNTSYGTKYLSDYKYKYKSGISDGSARMDFEWTPNSSNSVRFGGEYTFHTFKPETSSFTNKAVEGGTVQTDSTYNELDGRKMRGHEASAFIEDDIFIGEKLSFNPGLHYTAFYTDGKVYNSLQPRLSARMDLGKGYAVKAAYSRMAQYVHLLTSTDISLPTDLWVPITKNIKPVIGDHYSIGAYYSGLKGWEFSLEGYYKKTKNIVEYQDGATVMGTSANWYDKVSMGEGRSYGAEVFVQKTFGKTTGFVSYTLSKSDRIFRDGMVNNGRWYPYKYDRRHNLVVSVFHKFSDRVDVAGNFVFTTGGTTTVPTRQIVAITPDGTSTYDDYVPYKNNYRLPCSHRLNLGVNLHKQKRHGERIWNFSIYNVYNAMNPNLVYSDTDYNAEDGNVTTNTIRIKKITLLPFMPSISYTFKF
ncbi:MAG: carboxypeptidase-like regulatory domain-containing protein [Bacteroidales bacterium]|nr:carboxypeptidase-like regulatory domain-containing protein [Bacteroidales bacterium]MDY6001363.1 carboxypeptidase-like regulatory domain-containing protein [Candidatus Cryptobacteroides sp.]